MVQCIKCSWPLAVGLQVSTNWLSLSKLPFPTTTVACTVCVPEGTSEIISAQSLPNVAHYNTPMVQRMCQKWVVSHEGNTPPSVLELSAQNTFLGFYKKKRFLQRVCPSWTTVGTWRWNMEVEHGGGTWQPLWMRTRSLIRYKGRILR